MPANDKVNILMVDDQPGKLLSYEVILEELGENLIKANSGKEALECLLKDEIAIVLMDVSMPDLDGFELAEMIRQHPRFQMTAIIFISAVHMQDIDQLKGYQRGGVDYISVPVIPELLRAKVSVFAELFRKTKQLEQLNSDLRRLSSRLITMQDEERRRIARELHDGLGQDLVAAKMLLDQCTPRISEESKIEKARQASGIMDLAIQQVRSMSHLLHPPLLDEVGIVSALTWYVDGFSKRSGIKTSVGIEPADFPRLDRELEITIFRVVQEALTNVFRHAQARQAWVNLCNRANKVTASVRDDGQGVSQRVANLKPGSIGIGIGGMKQRVRELGGDITIVAADPGTIVEIVIPSSIRMPLDMRVPV
jgi:signal transduction histidine kinase